MEVQQSVRRGPRAGDFEAESGSMNMTVPVPARGKDISSAGPHVHEGKRFEGR